MCSRHWLEIAVATGRIDICRTVLRVLNLFQPSKHHRHESDAFQAACHYNQVHIARCLHEKQDIQHPFDLSPGLRIAASLPSLALLNLLIDLDADINKGDPVSLAIGKGHKAVMKQMIRHGARLTGNALQKLHEQHCKKPYKPEYSGLRSFVTKKSKITTYYYAAKLAEGRFKVKSTDRNYFQLLIYDVEDSKEWSARVEGRYEENETVGCAGAKLYGEYLLGEGF